MMCCCCTVTVFIWYNVNLYDDSFYKLIYNVSQFETRFLYEKEACSGNLESWEPSQHLLLGTRKPRKTCVEMAGRRTLRILTSSQQLASKVKKSNAHTVQQIHIR